MQRGRDGHGGPSPAGSRRPALRADKLTATAGLGGRSVLGIVMQRGFPHLKHQNHHKQGPNIFPKPPQYIYCGTDNCVLNSFQYLRSLDSLILLVFYK